MPKKNYYLIIQEMVPVKITNSLYSEYQTFGFSYDAATRALRKNQQYYKDGVNIYKFKDRSSLNLFLEGYVNGLRKDAADIQRKAELGFVFMVNNSIFPKI